jgi:uncharacterized protein
MVQTAIWYDYGFMLSLDLQTIRSALERFEQVYSAEVFPAEPDEFRVVAPVSLSFDIRKNKDQYQVTGEVHTTLQLSCSRCVESFSVPVDARFDLRYQPRTLIAGGDEREIEEDDFATAFYENEHIDLGQLIREQLYLALPMKPLCREDCRGLCPQCGTNLNRGTCDCKREWEDPRFAALRALKTES